MGRLLSAVCDSRSRRAEDIESEQERCPTIPAAATGATPTATKRMTSQTSGKAAAATMARRACPVRGTAVNENTTATIHNPPGVFKVRNEEPEQKEDEGTKMAHIPCHSSIFPVVVNFSGKMESNLVAPGKQARCLQLQLAWLDHFGCLNGWKRDGRGLDYIHAKPPLTPAEQQIDHHHGTDHQSRRPIQKGQGNPPEVQVRRPPRGRALPEVV